MSVFDRDVLAERAMTVERHLRRVGERLPDSAAGLQPATDVSDAVILHLWQATQIVIDLAMAACLWLKLGTPATYADAFRLLQKARFHQESAGNTRFKLTRRTAGKNILPLLAPGYPQDFFSARESHITQPPFFLQPLFAAIQYRLFMR